jgi:hypothetical protein
MKKLTLLFLILSGTFQVYSQSPSYFSFQSVIRNNNSVLVIEQDINLRISIFKNDTLLPELFSEEHSLQTNKNGLVSMEIGKGVNLVGQLNSIDWSNGEFYVKTEIDIDNDQNYDLSGITQMLSVPFSMFSNISDSTLHQSPETDPLFTGSVSSGITSVDTTYWNNKLDSYTETDPVFGSSVAGGITSIDTSNWNNNISVETDPLFTGSVSSGITSVDTTYWNNKLDSYTETDPVFGSSVAGGITSIDTSNWNNNISVETDPLFTGSVSSGITSGDTTYWNNKLDSYTETDPVFGSSVAGGITTSDTSNWNNKLDSYTETDPVFGSSVAGGITSTDTSNWNMDISDTNEIQSLSITGDTLSLSHSGGSVILPSNSGVELQVSNISYTNGNGQFYTNYFDTLTLNPNRWLEIDFDFSQSTSGGSASTSFSITNTSGDVYNCNEGNQIYASGGTPNSQFRRGSCIIKNQSSTPKNYYIVLQSYGTSNTINSTWKFVFRYY